MSGACWFPVFPGPNPRGTKVAEGVSQQCLFMQLHAMRMASNAGRRSSTAPKKWHRPARTWRAPPHLPSLACPPWQLPEA